MIKRLNWTVTGTMVRTQGSSSRDLGSSPPKMFRALPASTHSLGWLGLLEKNSSTSLSSQLAKALLLLILNCLFFSLFRICVVTNYFNREQHLPTTSTFASSAVRGGELLETCFNWTKIHVSFVGALRHGKMINGPPWCAIFISRHLDRQT